MLLAIACVAFFVLLVWTAFFGSVPGWFAFILWSGVLIGSVRFGLQPSCRALIDVNEAEGTIAIPWEGTRVTIPRGRVAEIEMDTETRDGNDGPYEVYFVVLAGGMTARRGKRRASPIMRNKSTRRHLASWLSERLGIAPAHPRNPDQTRAEIRRSSSRRSKLIATPSACSCSRW